MKRLVLLLGLLTFLRWRRGRFDADDRANGYGAYARVVPAS